MTRFGSIELVMNDSVALKEQTKYERMWDIPAYRTYSPGEKALPSMLSLMKEGSSIGDFGCGTGRASQMLRAHGFMVTAIDFASNCLDPNVNVPFHQACLWELPDDMLFDFGYCTDVMEHIPTGKVSATLKAIAGATRYGCFFQIATFKDRFGDEIGERLHLSVYSADVWESALQKHWPKVRLINGGREARFWVSH